ncbi:MAG: thioredoxin TrxC [Magnetococcales bacterium]|nr:thioredoxin TrxC [Magnetococcales bacterium]NGZ25671.1 thioredoxin TrxC [Magnetococcales bacterium]
MAHCPSCKTTNRIPQEKALAAAKCGQCGNSLPPLFSEHPIAVTDATFQQEVVGFGGPVVVDFWAPWCGPCRSLAPSLEFMAKELLGKVKFVKVNTDENPVLSRTYQIRSIPTLIFFKDGRVKEQIAGALPLGQLRNWIGKSMGWL